MADPGLLVGLVFAVGLVLLLLFAWRSYQRKKRIAQAKSRAALNRLLAEADELQQRSQQPPTDD